jgi:hypothetical protein
MSRDQLARRCRRLLERLSQPSSAAGLAALRALLGPQLAEHAPASRRSNAQGEAATGRDQASRSGCWRLTTGSAPPGGGASAVALAGMGA